MKPKIIAHETWLDLSKAAQYLGVHFTTLRRWADSGEITCIRTPGGRRRFSAKELEAFINRLGQVPDDRPPTGSSPVIHHHSAWVPQFEEKAIGNARLNLRNLPAKESWLGRMSDDQRLSMKGTGHRLMALLLQYNSRADGGEAFLEEGRRITQDYSAVCVKVGLSLTETVQVFLFFRRSILDSIHATGYLGGSGDHEGQRLYHRTTEFLDDLLLHLIQSYQNLLV